MLELDGTFGEGGGQILRTALSLSLVTGKPFRIVKIRGRRKKPGLQRQHLTGVQAAAAIGQAEVEGDRLNSTELSFTPRGLFPGDYHFPIGTAGSTSLVLQAILPALTAADGPSRLQLQGGTHNMHAPPFDYLDRVFLPLVNRTGPTVEAQMHRVGFYPAGGGRVSVSIQPASTWRRLELCEPGRPEITRVVAMVARLPRHIGQREVDVIARMLGLPQKKLQVLEIAESNGPGNAVMIETQNGIVTELFTGFGQRGVKAEDVARAAAKEAQAYLRAKVPVGPHLADQLLIPLALAGGGAFVTCEPTLHTKTNIEVVQRFLPVRISVHENAAGGWRIEVER